jgi:hypothetical protein
LVQKLLSTLEGEEGMTVTKIADECDLKPGSVHMLMARHGGDDGLFFGFGTIPRQWRIRRKDDQRAAPAMDSKTLVQKLLSTLEGEDGMTVAEIAVGCELKPASVHHLMARYGGDDGLFFGLETRPRQWRNRPNSDQGAAPAKDKKRDRSEDGRDDDANAALPKRKKSWSASVAAAVAGREASLLLALLEARAALEGAEASRTAFEAAAE